MPESVTKEVNGGHATSYVHIYPNSGRLWHQIISQFI